MAIDKVTFYFPEIKNTILAIKINIHIPKLHSGIIFITFVVGARFRYIFVGFAVTTFIPLMLINIFSNATTDFFLSCI